MVPPPLDNNNNNNNNNSSRGEAYDAAAYPSSQHHHHHQRNKSSVFRSFISGNSNSNSNSHSHSTPTPPVHGHHHHKRNNSDGTTTLPPPNIATNPDFYASEQNLAAINRAGVYHVGWEPPTSPVMPPTNPISTSRYPPITRHGYALEELVQNRQDNTRSPAAERPPPVPRGRFDPQYTSNNPPPSSPTKLSSFSTLKALGTSKPPKSSSSPVKPKKAKSATNLGGLLLRPKSYKNLKNGEDESGQGKDKENRSPGGVESPPPIYAQFASGGLSTSPPVELPIRNSSSGTHSVVGIKEEGKGKGGGMGSRDRRSRRGRGMGVRPRPKSFTSYVTGSGLRDKRNGGRKSGEGEGEGERGGDQFQEVDLGTGGIRTRILGGGGGERPPAGLNNHLGGGSGSSNRSKSTTRVPNGGSGGRPRGRAGSNTADLPAIEPQDIDRHLEAMLDRRNIPENQRYKMRNLSDTVKMEFIRQDWAEMVAKKNEEVGMEGRQSVNLARGSMDVGARGRPTERELDEAAAGDKSTKKKKHGRGLSLTLGRGGGGKGDGSGGGGGGEKSPTKKKGDSSLGRHFRGKSSSESLVGGGESGGEGQQGGGGDGQQLTGGGLYTGFIAKVKGQQLPGDFVSYLRKVQKPELVEVGKLHKLRLLLRNETVAWIEEFIRQCGMEEIVDLLKRTMALEWREEHEDALLHEVLLCLKALCTTSLALKYLHTIHATLFPSLLHLIFDPEKKGPSEFTTRNIITSILFTYIQHAPSPGEKITRASTVLSFLRDPDPIKTSQTIEFIAQMQKPRPYRVWNKEVVNVTKEVFWIFLHNLNIVALPPPRDETSPEIVFTHEGYMERHFPQERPPVPAAPYVGGVEWDATNYLASHLDLLNAIIACTGPTREERNQLREELRVSGWEKAMGGTMRMCKEKFYGGVHDGLRTWVKAAVEDGWDVRDVRFGPPVEAKSRGASPAKKQQPPVQPPRLEMPKFDFGPLPQVVPAVVGDGGSGSQGVGLGINTSVAHVGNGGAGGGGGGGMTPKIGTPRVGGVVKADDFWLS
ncbi:LOW QUALITY PROTEIN: hypothetical protein QC764_408160 [Podospora pseudoanserina]|uniref:Formin GTPase-binding domain-containing protein n=1 Tax=Podospora pseudoanserina TaxID=2609844 RepID=A0ABR0I9U9_9PEZI|nr:LOW QUALITY PROTEIN: hypothetical protein QC764_408160 [Podospora pseudoanserina]